MTTDSLPTTASTTPAPGRWVVDPTHSSVEFVVRHLFSRMRGRFNDYEGVVVIDEDPSRSTVEAVVRTGSVDTAIAARDEHLRGEEFLQADQFPEMRFRSTGVRLTGDDRGEIDGELEIRGVTRTVTLTVEHLGTAGDPWGGTKACLSAYTEIDREEFGVSGNSPLPAGGLLVGRTVRIELNVELTQEA
ncbi:YceI family protein [Streptoalloteichus hindustanus]|uniref:Polyisoprenoid-binding protein YceI n=1 Tax=Streptoalloteichus hindustanus TaxID=2017 RepID=A0A1M5QB35_STRHI|nr:YceI family protein [Streptoalloteichus hindustanus]SHH11357.1 Polyisoprenoid-binding protein YceI [Streptoalloteichus hindustanus]